MSAVVKLGSPKQLQTMTTTTEIMLQQHNSSRGGHYLVTQVWRLTLQGDNAMMRTVKAILIAPIVVLWDVLYWTVRKLYEGMTIVDKKGEKIIERFLDER